MIFNPFTFEASSSGGSWDLTCLTTGVIHAHYDFTNAANLTLSGTDVNGVTDLSGNGFDLTSALTLPPTWNSGSELVEIVESTTTVQSFEATLGAGGTDYGVYLVVMEPKTVQTSISRFVGWSSTVNDYIDATKIVPFAEAKMGTIVNSIVELADPAVSSLNNGQEIWVMKATTSGFELRKDGLILNSAVIGTQRVSFENEITIGRAHKTNRSSSMDIKEFILLKGDVSDDIVDSVEWYLASKHSLTLDAGHAYKVSDPVSCNPGVIVPPSLDMTAMWNVYFSAHNDYHAGFNTALGADGNSYFITGNEVGNRTEAYSDKVDLNLNQGQYLITNGLINSVSEVASMNFGTIDTLGTNFIHKVGDFTMFAVYTWDGNTNDINYKHWAGGKKGFKIEGAGNGINISDGFNTAFDGTGIASGGITFDFDPLGAYLINTGNPFFICVQRDTINKKYITYIGEITSGNDATNIKIHDTVTDSGQYLVNPFNNSNDKIEFLIDEGSTLHAFGYSNNVGSIGTINSTFEFLITRFS